MAKKKQPSVRSRNVRRAVTPPLEDPVLPATSTDNVSGKTRVMENIADLTVRGEFNNDDDDDNNDSSKKKKNKTNLSLLTGSSSGKVRKAQKSSKQKKRQMEAINKAEALQEIFYTKVQQSKQKFSVIKERKKDWEDYNKNIIKSKSKHDKSIKDMVEHRPKKNAFALLQEDESSSDNDENNQEEMNTD